jgi:hypothetical protein
MAITKRFGRTISPESEPESEVVRALRKVCEEDDSRRVVDLLAGGSVTAADATACLKRSWRLKVPVMRLLLEHGADPAACGTTRYMQKSLELMKLLVEFGYDIKINGHWVLQYAIVSTVGGTNVVWLTHF